MIEIQLSHEDDPGFIEQVQWILTGCIKQYGPAEVYVIRIRDFFDYKWCYFSGKILGAVGVSDWGNLTLPPFVPNRIISQDHHERVGTSSGTYGVSDAPPLHKHQSSESNLKRFIRRTT